MNTREKTLRALAFETTNPLHFAVDTLKLASAELELLSESQNEAHDRRLVEHIAMVARRLDLAATIAIELSEAK